MRAWIVFFLLALSGCLTTGDPPPEPAPPVDDAPEVPVATPAPEPEPADPDPVEPAPADDEPRPPPPAPPVATHEAGRFEYSFEHHGLERWGKIYVPAGLEVGQPVPMMVYIHAGSAGPNHIFRVIEMQQYADAHGFLMLTPAGHPDETTLTEAQTYSWRALDCCPVGEEDPDDVGFVHASIDWAMANYDVDPARVGLAGHSEGATLAYMVAVERPERFRFTVAAAGYVGVSKVAGLPLTTVHDPDVPMNVLISHSTDDPQVPYHGGLGPLSLKPWLYKAPVQDAIDLFVGNLDGATEPEVTQNGTHTRYVWRSADGVHRVVHYETVGGHNWPGIAPADTFPYTVLVQTPADPYIPAIMRDWLIGDLP